MKVEYEVYEPIVTVEAAMAEGATPLHPDIRKDNVIVHSHMTMGEKDFTFDEGLRRAKKHMVRKILSVWRRIMRHREYRIVILNSRFHGLIWTSMGR